MTTTIYLLAALAAIGTAVVAVVRWGRDALRTIRGRLSSFLSTKAARHRQARPRQAPFPVPNLLLANEAGDKVAVVPYTRDGWQPGDRRKINGKVYEVVRVQAVARPGDSKHQGIVIVKRTE